MYVHVPFCPSICPYCNFHKMLRNEGLVARYVDRIVEEFAERPPSQPLRSIYFGGGTPSHLTDGELTRVVNAIHEHADTRSVKEFTLEADPLTFTEERLALFRNLGVTRLSIGLQSTQDAVLSYLGRVHSATDGIAAVTLATKAGFSVNADLITAIEQQDLPAEIETYTALGIDHISVYTLIIEPDTPFGWRGETVDPDLEADAFEQAAALLQQRGFTRYETSNFARAGHESLHNLAYWEGAYYSGFGPAAAGYYPGVTPFGTRRTNPPIKTWLEHAAPEAEELTAGEYLTERLLTGLRMIRGFDAGAAETLAGTTFAAAAPGWWEFMETNGVLERVGTIMRATPFGVARVDAVVREFMKRRVLP